MMRSLDPSASPRPRRTSRRRSTFWVPWSTTRTSSRISSTAASDARFEQLVDAEVRSVEGGDADGDPPRRSPVGVEAPDGLLQVSSPSPASTSNQYQPPSMNGASESSNSRVCVGWPSRPPRSWPSARAPSTSTGRRSPSPGRAPSRRAGPSRRRTSAASSWPGRR